MSYFEKREIKNEYVYQIEPTESFGVIHNCGGCGRKERFINTKRFRVNANGNRLDVWLIYQCEKCKHTLNLSIYERVDRKKIPKDEYQLFLKNDGDLAEQYGMDGVFFKRNRAEVDWDNVLYKVSVMGNCERQLPGTERTELPVNINWNVGDIMVIHNPCAIRIRPEKLAGMIMNMSRSMVKKMVDKKEMIFNQNGFDLEILIC